MPGSTVEEERKLPGGLTKETRQPTKALSPNAYCGADDLCSRQGKKGP
jgi:hypothetical protein